MIDSLTIFEALPLDALRLVLLVEIAQIQAALALGQLAGVCEAEARLCQKVAPTGKVVGVLDVPRELRISQYRSVRCKSKSLVELGLLHYGHLDISGGAVTVNLFWVPLGAVQGLAESFVVLDELTALGQDERLVFTTLRIPQLF